MNLLIASVVLLITCFHGDPLGKQESHRDLSHPVHSDNCILDDLTGECNKVAPAYTWRDYRYNYTYNYASIK